MRIAFVLIIPIVLLVGCDENGKSVGNDNAFKARLAAMQAQNGAAQAFADAEAKIPQPVLAPEALTPETTPVRLKKETIVIVTGQVKCPHCNHNFNIKIEE